MLQHARSVSVRVVAGYCCLGGSVPEGTFPPTLLLLKGLLLFQALQVGSDHAIIRKASCTYRREERGRGMREGEGGGVREREERGGGRGREGEGGERGRREE